MVNEAQLSPDGVSENPCLTPNPKPMTPKMDFLLVLTVKYTRINSFGEELSFQVFNSISAQNLHLNF